MKNVVLAVVLFSREIDKDAATLGRALFDVFEPPGRPQDVWHYGSGFTFHPAFASKARIGKS